MAAPLAAPEQDQAQIEPLPRCSCTQQLAPEKPVAKLVLFLYLLFTRRKDSNRLCAEAPIPMPTRNHSQDYEAEQSADRAEISYSHHVLLRMISKLLS
jgi:hypothetical protein